MGLRKFFQDRAKRDEEKIELSKKNAEKKLEGMTEKMLQLPCPFRQGLCSKECVHFSAGYTWQYYADDYRAAKPKCKLWK